jgi:hypothetical protein
MFTRRSKTEAPPDKNHDAKIGKTGRGNYILCCNRWMEIQRTFIHSLKPLPTLDELINEARCAAELSLKMKGYVAPELIATTERGKLIHFAGSLESEREKDAFAAECRLLLIATAATCCTLVMETWMAQISAEAPNLPPSQTPERVEVVSVAAEAHSCRRMLLLPICRRPSGKFKRLGEDIAPPGVELGGRFARLLPLTRPTPQQQEQARALLDVMGVNLPSHGFSNS